MRHNCCFKYFYQAEFEKQNEELVEQMNYENQIDNLETNINDMENPMMPQVSEMTEIQNNQKPNIEKVGIENINLEEYFPDSHIEELINFYFQKLKEKPEKNYKKLGTTKKNNLLDFQIWAKFKKKKNSSNNLHQVYCEMEWNFPIDHLVYFDLNNNKIINDKVDISERLNVQKSENGTIRYLKHTKTKKILIIQPRHTLDIFAIKKLEDGSYIEVGLCITKTDLKENPDIIEFMENKDKELFISNTISANQYFFEDGICKQKMFKISDPNTGVGFMLLKGVIKSSSMKYYKKFGVLLEKFYKDVLEEKIDLNDEKAYPFFKNLREIVTKNYLVKNNN